MGCGGREEGAAGVELLEEHGLNYEPEGHLGVLNGVHEKLRGESGAVYVVAYSSFLLLCYFPIVFLY